MRNFNLGVASVAYMRRVVKNRLKDMLDILHEAAIAHNIPTQALEHYAEMKEEKRFNLKIDYAGRFPQPRCNAIPWDIMTVQAPGFRCMANVAPSLEPLGPSCNLERAKS
jgi:hypothetical protein